MASEFNPYVKILTLRDLAFEEQLTAELSTGWYKKFFYWVCFFGVFNILRSLQLSPWTAVFSIILSLISYGMVALAFRTRKFLYIQIGLFSFAAIVVYNFILFFTIWGDGEKASYIFATVMNVFMFIVSAVTAYGTYKVFLLFKRLVQI